MGPPALVWLVGSFPDEARDAGGDRGLLVDEAVRRAALTGLDARLRAGGPAGTAGHGDDLLARAVGPRRDVGHESRGRADTRVGGVADDEDGHADVLQAQIEYGLRHPGPLPALAAGHE